MGTSITLNATSYTIPAVGEDNWGTDVTNYLVALSTGVLSKAGGAFTLTAEADFGTGYGLKSIYFKSRGTVASAGVLRLANTELVSWRNAANDANLSLTVNSSNILEFNSAPVFTLALGTANHVLKMNSGGTAYEFGTIANANVDASAAIAYSKLALTGNIVNADISGSAAIAYSKLDLTGSVVNADIAAAAAIAYSKLAALTASRVLVSDGSGFVSASSITATTLGYLDATSSIQTQLDAKFDDADVIDEDNMASDSNTKVPTQQSVKAYADLKAALTGATFTGHVVLDNAQSVRFSETDANGSHYIGLKAPDSVTGDITFVLPDGDGSANQVLKTDGSAALGWATVATVEQSLVTDTPAAAYSIANADESVHVLTPSEACVLTLSNDFAAGRIITLINLSTSFDISVRANDASVIFTLYRDSRNQVVCSTGSPGTNTSWRVLNVVTSPWINGGAVTSQLGAGWGTPTDTVQYYKREGDTLHWWATWEAGTVAANAANCSLPLSLSLDTAKIGASRVYICGRWYTLLNSGSTIPQNVLYYNSAAASALYISQASTGDLITAANVNDLFNNSDTLVISASVPISGWGQYSG